MTDIHRHIPLDPVVVSHTVDYGKTPDDWERHADELEQTANRMLPPDPHRLTTAWMLRRLAEIARLAMHTADKR